MARPFVAGLWRLIDPKISLASLASIFLGACVALRDAPFAPGWMLLTVAGILAIEAAKNASGEIFDFDSGTDLAVSPEERTPFSGGKRVLVEKLLTRAQTGAVAAAGYALGIAAGLTIAAFREPRVLGLGLFGVACAWLYHAPPIRMSYRGLGEVAVAVCYGPLLCAGTYLVQRRAWSAEALAASLPLGLLVAAFLWVNEFPDARADERAGKRTLVVRLGRRRASRAYAGLVGGAFALLAVLPAWGSPPGVRLGLVGLPFAAASVRVVLGNPGTPSRLVPAQRAALAAFVLGALGSGIGHLLRG